MWKLKKLSNENILPFITIFNTKNNPNIYSTIKSSVNCLKNNNVSGFHNINLIQSKRQPPNLKKLLTNAEYGEVLSGTFNYSDKRWDCCNYFLMNDHYTFTTFKLHLSCNSSLLVIGLISYMPPSVTHVRRNILKRQGKEKLN